MLYLQLTQYLTVQDLHFHSGGWLTISANACIAFCGRPKALHRFELESLRPWREGGRNKTLGSWVWGHQFHQSFQNFLNSRLAYKGAFPQEGMVLAKEL